MIGLIGLPSGSWRSADPKEKSKDQAATSAAAHRLGALHPATPPTSSSRSASRSSGGVCIGGLKRRTTWPTRRIAGRDRCRGRDHDPDRTLAGPPRPGRVRRRIGLERRPRRASLALLAFFVAFLGLGFLNVAAVLTLLAIPPILTNTHVGVRQVDRESVDAAR